MKRPVKTRTPKDYYSDKILSEEFLEEELESLLQEERDLIDRIKTVSYTHLTLPTKRIV